MRQSQYCRPNDTGRSGLFGALYSLTINVCGHGLGPLGFGIVMDRSGFAQGTALAVAAVVIAPWQPLPRRSLASHPYRGDRPDISAGARHSRYETYEQPFPARPSCRSAAVRQSYHGDDASCRDKAALPDRRRATAKMHRRRAPPGSVATSIRSLKPTAFP
jgi:hypothetical protein